MTLLSDEWGYMAANDPGSTDWESFQPDGTVNGGGTSWAHGWSTGSTTALSQDVLGVSPASPGYQTWLVRPHPGTLSWAEGQAPTPRGPLTVDWGHRSQASGEFAMHVSVPRGNVRSHCRPDFGRPVSIQVNGHQAWNGQRATAAGVRAAQAATSYLSGVPGGSYDIVTHPAGPVARSCRDPRQGRPRRRGHVVAQHGDRDRPGPGSAERPGHASPFRPGGRRPGGVRGQRVRRTGVTVVTVHVTPPSGVSGGPVPLTVTASRGAG